MNKIYRRSSAKCMSRWTVIALISFSYAWRIQSLDRQSLWRDEIDTIYFALRELPTVFSMFSDTGQNGALYFLTLRPWLRMIGSSEFALRYPAVLFGVLAIPTLWQVARRIIPSSRNLGPRKLVGSSVGSKRSPLKLLHRQSTVGNTALLAALFLTINPYHLSYSQEGKMYSLITLLALLAVWLWIAGIDKGGWKPWLGFFITMSVAIYTHLLMILMIPLFIIWFLIAWPQSKGHWKGFSLALAGLTVPYIPLLVWQWKFLLADEKLTAFEYSPLAEVARTIILYQSISILPPRNLIYLVPIVILGLSATFFGHKAIKITERSPLGFVNAERRLLLIVAWFFVPILAIYILSLQQPVFRSRYVIWIAPAAMILLSLGTQLVWLGKGKLARVLAFGIVIYVIFYWGNIGAQQKSYLIKTDLRSAVRYISERRQPDELLILQIPHTQYAYRYYSGDQGSRPFDYSEERLGWWANGLSTNDDLGVEEARDKVDYQLNLMTAGAEDIWIILTEVELQDSRHLMEEWLTQNTELIDLVDFQGVQIRQYRTEERLFE